MAGDQFKRSFQGEEMSIRILCVDDDRLILDGYRRQFRKVFDLYTAGGGEAGLEMLKRNGPFAVIVSDMNMPGMNGIEFLARARQIAPESVRIMLTGVADLQVAINALNEGHIFRFLTKPCDAPVFAKALTAGIMQYRLVHAEKELLEKTFTSTVRVLIELLEAANPLAYSRAMRIKGYVLQIVDLLGLDSNWQYELAAMLSQIGCVNIPADTLEKIMTGGHLYEEEKEMKHSFPAIGRRLIESIPRLESVAEMVGNQDKPFREYDKRGEPGRSISVIGAQMLKASIDLDVLISQDLPLSEACLIMGSNNGEYNPEILRIIDQISIPYFEKVVRILKAINLSPGMVLAEDVISRNGTLIVCKGKELTELFVSRLRHFVQQSMIPNSFRISSGPQPRQSR